MRFAKFVYLFAGIYGLIVLVPQYFLESKIGLDSPPPITHPEFFYGFLGVTIAWQVLFMVVSRDPIRYRALTIPALLEKAGFVIAVALLFRQGRVASTMLIPAGIDLMWGILFVVAYLRTRPNSP